MAEASDKSTAATENESVSHEHPDRFARLHCEHITPENSNYPDRRRAQELSLRALEGYLAPAALDMTKSGSLADCVLS
jgi:hypothetical protein